MTEKTLRSLLISAGAMLCFGLTACGPASQTNNDASNTSAAPGECEVVKVDGTDEDSGEYCVWRGQNIIIETGYSCPQLFSYRHDYGQDLIVCSRFSRRPPTPIFRRIEDLLNATMPPNNTTTGGRTCGEVQAELATTAAAFGTSCMADADCVKIEQPPCGCGTPISSGQDQTTYDGLLAESEQLGCGQGVDCSECPQSTLVCQDNTCVLDFNAGRTCEDITADIQTEDAQLATSCNADTDCKMVFGPGCGCGQAVRADEDLTSREGLVSEYDAEDCDGGVICNRCLEDTAVCQNNTCVAIDPNDDPSCLGDGQAYTDALDALDDSCTVDTDCQMVPQVCGLNGCDTAVNASEDLGALDTLAAKYTNEQTCAPPCAQCEAHVPRCENSTCVGRPADEARTCSDISMDYQDAVDAADKSCQTVQDCVKIESICGLSGCGITVSASADRTTLSSLESEYDAHPAPGGLGSCSSAIDCAACEDTTLSCEDNVCKTTAVQARSCQQIKDDYTAQVGALDNSCTSNEDCVSFAAGTCVGSCSNTANASADRSGLQTLEQEFVDSCPEAQVCGACAAPADAVCQDDVCVIP